MSKKSNNIFWHYLQIKVKPMYKLEAKHTVSFLYSLKMWFLFMKDSRFRIIVL